MGHDPFTIDLFGNSVLVSGFDLGATGLCGDLEPAVDIDSGPPPSPAATVHKERDAKLQMRTKIDFRLQGSRGLGKTWRARARDNIAAILLANEIERHRLPARPDQQARLIKFTGFGASGLANAIFRRPGDEAFRKGWEELASNLESAVTATDYASLARCTQYAHFTPEFIVGLSGQA